MTRHRRDPTDRALEIEAHARRTDSTDALLVAADAWEEAGDLQQAKILRIEADLISRWSRQELIAWLEWNDPNGFYSDKDHRRNDMDPLEKWEAVDLVMEHVREAGESPEEMIRSSRRPW